MSTACSQAFTGVCESNQQRHAQGAQVTGVWSTDLLAEKMLIIQFTSRHSEEQSKKVFRV